MLEAALAELAESGLARLSMESIARRAGVNKTTLYRRWGDWETLLADAMLARAEERVPIPDTGSLRDDLRALAEAVAADSRSPESQAVVRAVAAEAAPGTALLEAKRRFWAERFALDGEVVQRAIARGEVGEDVDPQTAVEAVLGPLYFRLLVTGEELDDEFIGRIVDLVVAALQNQSPR